ncbi:hypothetical protein, partial [Salmonella enterica]|uniref:hypothetical protein n=1 Tax=Salmonella enterica TaxID=28901 RepID=UPI001C46891C
ITGFYAGHIKTICQLDIYRSVFCDRPDIFITGRSLCRQATTDGGDLPQSPVERSLVTSEIYTVIKQSFIRRNIPRIPGDILISGK